jgi:formate dehydrogenase
MAKIVCVLQGDPIDKSSKTDPRDNLPGTDRHPGGQTVPTPSSETPAGGKSIFDPHLELGMP